MPEPKPEEQNIENEEPTEEEKANLEEEDFKIRSSVSLSGPEAVVLFAIAITLDLLGMLLLFVMLDDFFILDIIGITLIGMWIFFRTGHMPSKKSKSRGKKLGKGWDRRQYAN